MISLPQQDVTNQLSPARESLVSLCTPRKGIARGLSPNFHIHVTVRDLYIPRIGPHIFLQENRHTGCWNT
jgi:hypothetical protein